MAAPVVVKVAAKIALHAADEETRKKILTLIFGTVIGVTLLLTMFVHMITSPLETIAGFFSGDEDTKALNDFREQYKNDVSLDLETGEIILNGQYPMPVNGPITSPYGSRVHPITGAVSFHSGVDIGGPDRSPIISVADGQVVETVTGSAAYGNYVVIKHAEFYSFYAHIIGLEGGGPTDPFAGLSTGAHLHFEIRTSADPASHVDPTPYLFSQEGEK